jgi:hypothetical protein
VFWRPEILPTIVLLERAPERFSETRLLDVAQLGDDPAERLGLDGRHVIVGNEVGEVRLWLRDAPQNEPLAIILPLDDDLPTRAEAALRLWMRIVGRRADHGRQPLALTRQRCDRLVLMLRALDGHLSEASYREIAEVLFGIRRLEREAWKTSSLRDQTIRLVKGGVVLMRAGYRRLLRGR